MPSTCVYFATDDPNADYRQLLDALLATWREHADPAIAEAVARSAEPRPVDDTDTVVDPLVDYGGFTVELPDLALLGGPAGHSGVLEIQCRPVFAPAAEPIDEDPAPVERIGRRVIVAVHPVDPTVDLGSLTALTAVLARTGEPIERVDWLAAFRVPGTSWIGGIDGAPTVAFGLVGAEPPADEQHRAEWRARVAERTAAATAAIGDDKLADADARAS